MLLFKLLILVFVVFNVSCTRVDLAIKWADTLLYYELKSIFDFEGKQKAVVEEASSALVADLKKDWLPTIADRLQSLSQKTDIKNETEIRALLNSEVEFINGHLKAMYVIVAKEVPVLTKVITAENWTNFKNEFEEKNKDILAKKEKSKIEDNIERFLGRLSNPQKELIAKWVQDNPVDVTTRVENRRHIVKTMDAKMNPWSADIWEQVLLAWLKDTDAYNLPAYKEYIKKRTDSMVNLLVDVLKIMSDVQRANLKSNLLDWQSKLRS